MINGERSAPAGPYEARPLAVSVKVACAVIGVGNTTLWALIKDGRIQTAKIGRRRLVIYESLVALIARERADTP